ncbi:hypothetical protein [Celeribacter ethanolicus]|nr:hypothetical protein [Celeribacter ethanolicus]
MTRLSYMGKIGRNLRKGISGVKRSRTGFSGISATQRFQDVIALIGG